MVIEIINGKKYSAERVFFCTWMELCGYLVIGRDHAIDRPVERHPVETRDGRKRDLLLGQAHDRIVLEIRESLLGSENRRTLVDILLYIMDYVGNAEERETALYDGYRDDRRKVIEKVAYLYVMDEIYLHSFILNRTYSTVGAFVTSMRKINECIWKIERWEIKRNNFLDFVILFLHSRSRKAQVFLKRISWSESMELIDRCDELLEKMKMSHYQDTLYLMKGHIYEAIPGKYDRVWGSFRRVKSEHYYVLYKLGYLKERYWEQDETAKEFYVRSYLNMPDYFRADYKLACYYEREKEYGLAESLYMQVIAKIWHIPIGKLKYTKYERIVNENHFARYFTMLDVDYLIKSWKRILSVLSEKWVDIDEDQETKLYERFQECYRMAELDYGYMEEEITKSEFLKKMFYSDEAYMKKMIGIIQMRIRESREELKGLYEDMVCDMEDSLDKIYY